MQIKDIQKALADQGYDPGPIDNVYGPLTRRAIEAFQTDRGLAVDGIVGRQTRAALFGGAGDAAPAHHAIPADMTWLIEAHRLIGVIEHPGLEDSNPVISDWARALNIRYSGDSVPWCGLFIAHCMVSGLPQDPIPANPLLARNWGRYGRQARPQFGGILVFWRGDKSGIQGHVGFYWAEDETHFHVLGGNQSNRVSVTRIPRSRLLDCRWPASRPENGIRRTASPAGVLVGVSEA